jgi:hypothetical protein
MYSHFIERAKERLNKDFTEYDCEVLNMMIRNNEAQVIKKPWFVLKYRGLIFKVCYQRGRVRTLLPIT